MIDLKKKHPTPIAIECDSCGVVDDNVCEDTNPNSIIECEDCGEQTFFHWDIDGDECIECSNVFIGYDMNYDGEAYYYDYDEDLFYCEDCGNDLLL